MVLVHGHFPNSAIVMYVPTNMLREMCTTRVKLFLQSCWVFSSRVLIEFFSHALSSKKVLCFLCGGGLCRHINIRSPHHTNTLGVKYEWMCDLYLQLCYSMLKNSNPIEEGGKNSHFFSVCFSHPLVVSTLSNTEQHPYKFGGKYYKTLQ